MYNDIILIVMSAFAVYGAYSVIGEILKLFSGKEQLVVAIRITDLNNENNLDDIFAVAEGYISENSIWERTPVVICETVKPEVIDALQYDVYVKYTEEEWSRKQI